MLDPDVVLDGAIVVVVVLVEVGSFPTEFSLIQGAKLETLVKTLGYLPQFLPKLLIPTTISLQTKGPPLSPSQVSFPYDKSVLKPNYVKK